MQIAEIHGTIYAAGATAVFAPRASRAWAILTLPPTAAAPAYVFLTMDQKKYGQIYLAQGQSLVFSRGGDMPWNGQIEAQAVGVDSTIYATEAYDE